MPGNALLVRTVAMLIGIAALLFIYVEGMSAWKVTSEAKKAAVEADVLSANRELIIENKASEMWEKLIRPDPFQASPAPAGTLYACGEHDGECQARSDRGSACQIPSQRLKG
jgi:hypothetical protein